MRVPRDRQCASTRCERPSSLFSADRSSRIPEPGSRIPHPDARAATRELIVTVAFEKGFQRAAQLGGEIFFADGMEQGNRRLIGLELRDAARTSGEVPFQIGVDRWREVVFDEVRQQTHEIGAATFVWHSGRSVVSAHRRPRYPAASRCAADAVSRLCTYRGSRGGLKPYRSRSFRNRNRSTSRSAVCGTTCCRPCLPGSPDRRTHSPRSPC
jgi:hypothetical protein